MKLSISGSKETSDPVTDATRKGRTPTLGEVKRSLKVISSSSSLVWEHFGTVLPGFDQESNSSHNSDGRLTQYVLLSPVLLY